jgi:hypothetical protein
MAPARMSTPDDADLRAFAERARDDRHHFRFIVSPETQPRWRTSASPATRVERDLGTDWIGSPSITGFDNPHIHLIVRRDDRGDTSSSIATTSATACAACGRAGDDRARAAAEHEVRRRLAGEVGADRWTRLDAPCG